MMQCSPLEVIPSSNVSSANQICGRIKINAVYMYMYNDVLAVTFADLLKPLDLIKDKG